VAITSQHDVIAFTDSPSARMLESQVAHLCAAVPAQLHVKECRSKPNLRGGCM